VDSRSIATSRPSDIAGDLSPGLRSEGQKLSHRRSRCTRSPAAGRRSSIVSYRRVDRAETFATLQTPDLDDAMGVCLLELTVRAAIDRRQYEGGVGSRTPRTRCR
jgi:hypothetical protein